MLARLFWGWPGRPDPPVKAWVDSRQRLDVYDLPTASANAIESSMRRSVEPLTEHACRPGHRRTGGRRRSRCDAQEAAVGVDVVAMWVVLSTNVLLGRRRRGRLLLLLGLDGYVLRTSIRSGSTAMAIFARPLRALPSLEHTPALSLNQCPAAHTCLPPSHPLPCAILHASPTLRAVLRELTCCSLIHRRRLHHSSRERVDVARRIIERSTCARLCDRMRARVRVGAWWTRE